MVSVKCFCFVFECVSDCFCFVFECVSDVLLFCVTEKFNFRSVGFDGWIPGPDMSSPISQDWLQPRLTGPWLTSYKVFRDSCFSHQGQPEYQGSSFQRSDNQMTEIVFYREHVQVFGCCLNNHFQRYEVTSVLHYGLHYKSISNVSCDIWFRNTFPGFQMTASMICNPGPVWGVGGL